MKIKIPFRLLSIEGDGYHIAIPLRINGKPANAIIDTGASKTVFDKERIAHFLRKETLSENDRLSTGLGTTSMQSHTVTLSSLRLGGLDIHAYTSVVLDLSHVNKTYEALGLKPIDGVVGSDLLRQFNAVIDYGNRVLVLNAMTTIPLRKKTAAKKKQVAKKRTVVKKKPAKKKVVKKSVSAKRKRK